MRARARLVWMACLLIAWAGGRPALLGAQQRPDESIPKQKPAGFTVSGRVVDAARRPAEQVTLSVGAERDGGFVSESSEVRSDGTFETRGLEPGLYVLEASAPPAPGLPSGAGGFATVVVRSADVQDVTITLHPSTTYQGVVKFESERDVAAPYPAVVVHAFLAVERMRINYSVSAPVADDGTFTLPPVHGPRVIRVGYSSETRSGWWPTAVRLDGVDVTNVPIDFATRPSARLEVVFSDRPTAVVGIVHDEAGLPVEAARVVLFSKDPAMWAAWSTAVQTGISDENGRFWFVDAMPPGDYRAIALRDNPPDSIAEAVDELSRLEKFAMPIVVSESKVARIEVIISRAR